MRQRLQSWLEETHGTGFELVRHFLVGFFDSDFVSASDSGEWMKVAFGILAILLSSGILGFRTYMERYDALFSLANPAVFRQAMREDWLLFIGLAMGVTALLTVLQWQSLFPSRRDCLVLGSWPVSPREIFAAKFGSLLLIFTIFVVAVAAIPAALFASVTAFPWRYNPSEAANFGANFAAAAGACVFAFFSLLALQGILLNLLPGRIFARVSLTLQAVLFMVILGALPLVGRWPTHGAWFPTAWFADLWESMLRGTPGSRTAVLAMAAPAVITVLSYLIAYHRYHRLLMEGAPGHTAASRWDGAGWRLLERWIREPREQAAFAFMWKTLVRSGSHRLILLAYGGIGLGCITKGALDTPRPSLHDQGIYGFLAVVAPLATAVVVTAGLRYLFSLPVALGANWLFQMNEREGRAAWLAAVERFVIWCGIAPVFLAALPAQIAVFGWLRAVAASVLALLAVLIGFEILFRGWHKLPFTCSHVPGKEPVLLTVGRWVPSIIYLATVGQLILYCSGEPTAFAALVTFEAVIWWRMRRKRRNTWADASLWYEDQLEDAPLKLGLPDVDPEAGPLVSTAATQTEPLLFAQRSLVASRGLLPAAWEEEIDADRGRPAALAGTFLEDLRYGLRVIRRNPGLSAVVVLTLTLGIGMNASVFTVVNGLALRPHVYKDPDTFLRVILQNRWETASHGVSSSEYQALRDRTRSLRQLAAWSYFPALIGDDDSTGSFGLLVSCNFFTVDGLDRPILGRLLVPDDCLAPGVAPVALISESTWRNRYGADPRLIGRSIQVNNRTIVVAGVVPDRTSSWTIPVKIWLPYTAVAYFEPGNNRFTSDDSLWLALAGRLAPGFSRSQAEAELNILEHQQDQEHYGRKTVVTTTDGSWIEEMELTASGRDLMLVAFFLGAFFLVLLIACANVATLLLSRAAVRKREIAVRLSLGAPRIRLVRMLVTESLLLAAIAGAISLFLTWKLPVPLFHLVATGAPDFPMPPDWRIFVYLSVVVLATGILSGLAPALESVKVDLLGSLKGYGGNLAGAGGARLRGWLISAQVGMSMVLLVEAALFAQSENQTLRANPGYLPERVVVSPLNFPDSNTLEQTTLRVRAITGRVKALPGVRSVAFSDGPPMLSRDTVELRPPTRPDASQPVDIYAVSPAFLETLGIPLVSGREFQDADASAVVVSQSLAKLFWPRQNPLGRILRMPGGTAPVVGVAKDVAPMRFGGSDNPAVYRLRHIDAHRNYMSVRFDSGASRGAPAVRAALRQSDPDLFIVARLLEAWIDQVTTILWNVVDLIVLLGVLATVLAAAGIYGAVNLAVSQRMRDLGIRAALGAQRFDIIREVFVSAGKPVAAGLLQGLWMSVAAAAALRRTMADSPIRLDTTNPLLYLGAALVLAVAAAAAMIGPARRGSRCDPLDALRCE
ncbi:MAG TPA: ADOP family duplicated permease [Bryobacteraceae bacterium]|nr:ADOP family duplicated permease [Bryobacteraceae bacterium]